MARTPSVMTPLGKKATDFTLPDTVSGKDLSLQDMKGATATVLMFVWALFTLFPYLNNLLACSVITLYTVIGARLEEKKLVMQFGEQYVLYKQKVPMIIPRLSPANK